MAKKIRTSLRDQIGDWAFVRYLRNSGISFPTAYYLMFGKQARKI